MQSCRLAARNLVVLTTAWPREPCCCLRAAASPSASPCTTPPVTARAQRTSSTPGLQPAPASLRRLRRPLSAARSSTNGRTYTTILQRYCRPNKRSPKSKPPDVVGKLFATFTLSRENQQSIKDIWTGEAARRGMPPPRCTSIVVMLAVIWQCFHLATASSEAEPDRHSRIHLVVLVDLRMRLEPRVPDKYLANCVCGCFASAQKKELIAVGVDVQNSKLWFF
ncbi:hypothetical protein GUJ93_ZPchr0006g43465 [Zizania palustris]|uniref:Uncharacterized protein n=1 Tax=Zizania palustris TaxID=103762 RepID=A0A8J5T6X9_ZIZPA|nr:hypothetical protein GUJ93_ZPchr0006g43465 [Zizania palustris]